MVIWWTYFVPDVMAWCIRNFVFVLVDNDNHNDDDQEADDGRIFYSSSFVMIIVMEQSIQVYHLFCVIKWIVLM